MDVDTDLIYQVVIVIFGILTVYFATGFMKARRIAAQVAVFLKETARTFELIGEALEDGQLTKEEISVIHVQAQENLNSARVLIDEIKFLARDILYFTKK